MGMGGVTVTGVCSQLDRQREEGTRRQPGPAGGLWGLLPQSGCPGTPAGWFPLMCCLTFHLISCPLISGSLGDWSLLSPGRHITRLLQAHPSASAPCLLWGVRV